MDIEDKMLFSMSFVQKHQYPLMDRMDPTDNDELLSVFNRSNRCSLVSWSLQLLNEECFEHLANGPAESYKSELAEIISSLGVATRDNAMSYISGELNPEEEVHITYRLLSNIETFLKSKNQVVTIPIIDMDNIMELKNLHINLFPKYKGVIKTLTPNELALKMEGIKKKLHRETLQPTVGSVYAEAEDVLHETIKLKDMINNLVNTVDEHLNEFERKCHEIQRCNVKPKDNMQFEIGPNFGNVLSKCNEYLVLIKQYMEDIQTINTFQVENIVNPNESMDELLSSMIDHLLELSKI